MDHYYAKDPLAASQPGEVMFRFADKDLVFQTDTGVFSRSRVDYGTQVLLGAMPALEGNLLDVGCGYGPIGLCLGVANPGLQVVMADVNTRALMLAGENAKRLRVAAEVLESDGFAGVRGRVFDTIVTNPPIRAGNGVYFPWFAAAPHYLAPGGSFYCVISKNQGAPSAKRAIEEHFGAVSVIGKSAGFWVIQASQPVYPGGHEAK